ncbi:MULTISPECIES: energy transducer TonB [Halomonas]|uniref:Protein TonB n=1 Tax=Halomonas ventosae TaxID=229007 RepID=A0A4R6HEH5_9GAMM|nr:TonB family protein [Halomonas ventosae]TDO06684.1 protein TonB [Halomonas ventosae]
MTRGPISDPIQYAPVTRAYRHWLAWSLALLLHLGVIGVVVASHQFAPAPVERTSIDVVLVSRPSAQAVQAKAIAEVAQRAIGTPQEQAPAEARAAPMDELPPERQAAEPDQPNEAPAATPEPPAAEVRRQTEVTPEPRDSAPQSVETPTAAALSASGRELLAQATSSIRERGFSPAFAGKQPGEDRQAAQQAAEARYIDDWTRRVEDYGNRMHPAPRDLEGQLRIRVVIGRDGQVRQAEVVQSSGHAELDQAALDTVHGAAPYRPFDRGMGNLDSLSITRVWRFGQGNHYGVQ